MPNFEVTTSNYETDQTQIVIYVTYAGTAGSRFDRDYYVKQHLPLVLRAWKSYGLLGVAAFFPAREEDGTLAVCECRFKDEGAVERSLAAPETASVMADLPNFTDLTANRARMVAI